MSVFHYANYNTNKFLPEDIMIGNTELVDSLAKKFIVDMTETNIETMFESGEEITRQFARDHLGSVKQCAVDYANDVIRDLQTALTKRITEIACDMYVTAIRYNDDGKVDDVEVRIDI